MYAELSVILCVSQAMNATEDDSTVLCDPLEALLFIHDVYMAKKEKKQQKKTAQRKEGLVLFLCGFIYSFFQLPLFVHIAMSSFCSYNTAPVSKYRN